MGSQRTSSVISPPQPAALSIPPSNPQTRKIKNSKNPTPHSSPAKPKIKPAKLLPWWHKESSGDPRPRRGTARCYQQEQLCQEKKGTHTSNKINILLDKNCGEWLSSQLICKCHIKYITEQINWGQVVSDLLQKSSLRLLHPRQPIKIFRSIKSYQIRCCWTLPRAAIQPSHYW